MRGTKNTRTTQRGASPIRGPRDVIAALIELMSAGHGRNDEPRAFPGRVDAPLYRRLERKEHAVGEGLRATTLLTQEELEVCRLRYGEGRQRGTGPRARLRPYPAIAAQLGVSVYVVRARLTSALDKVSAHIQAARDNEDSDGKPQHA